MASYPHLKKTVILRRPGVATFANIKIAFTLIKITYRNSIIVKRITNYVLKYNFYLYFPL